jgi:hypothetical protein
VGSVEAQRPLEEADAGRCLLVGEHLDIAEPGGVVDADVNELPAGDSVAARVGEAVAAVAGHPVAGPQDAAELLDVDVDQLARPLALVAVGRLERFQPAELAEPDARQDPLHRRERHAQAFRDLLAGHPHTAQRRDRRNAILRSGVGLPPGRGGSVEQPGLALLAKAAHPLQCGPLAHLGGSAASLSDQPSSTTRLASLSRCFGVRAALPWSFIR